MRIGVYLHPKRPKVSLGRIIKLIHSAGATYSHRDPDIAMVVGGMVLLATMGDCFLSQCYLWALGTQLREQQEKKDASSLSNLSHDYMQTFIEDYTVP